ncbi:hypothetical protein RclHR1_00570021 [Rhizophagus clarus]|uniref:Mating-type m-specific polypeptide mc n=1 Tax=Rhizophagus clarus TaxID=94130 RepID=A0A2Z6S122_9GLOM|nr:hypothetical protein RclHR1_00570021 [Rhizophagus clarus]GET04212.1 mating-type m-specific polypeptide mc [Rhizophagus clarus]
MSQSTFYVEKGFLNSRVPPTPPSKPTNRPIYLGNATDEEIVLSTKYEFTESLSVLLDNSKKSRRPRRSSLPPRPQNPFILYRRDKVKKHKNEYVGLRSAKVSKIIGEMWNDEAPEVKTLFEALARLSEKVHSRRHRDYRYQPRLRKNRNNKGRYSPYSPIPDSPDSTLSSPSSRSSTSDSSSDNEDMMFDFFTFDKSDPPAESNNTSSNFSALSDITCTDSTNISEAFSNITLSEPRDTSDTFCNVAPIGDIDITEPTVTSFGINSFNGLHTQAEFQVGPVPPLDSNFFIFAYHLYNFLHGNQNSPMRPGAENTAFLGSSLDEQD